MRKIEIDKDELYQKYCIQKLSQKKVADYFGISVDTIQARLNEYGFKANKLSDYVHKRIELSKEQKDYLYGALLGDGCLYIHKNGVNAQFSYLSKSFQHCKFVSKPFSNILISNGIKSGSYFDNRTGLTYSRYSFATQANIEFTEEYKKWYINRIKHIPSFLELNPSICLVWYIGDGGICRSNNSEYIKLSTHCFPRDEQEEILIPQLKDFKARTYKCGRSKTGDAQYAIFIPHEKEIDFLNYIGKCPFDDYAHKWNCKKYKNFSVLVSSSMIDDMINLFNLGLSAGRIAKKLSVDRSTVVKYLTINGCDYRENLFKRG